MSEPSTAVRTEDLRAWIVGLLDLQQVEDDERIEQLRLLERLKCAAAGAQARITIQLDESQKAVQRAAGARGRDVGKGVVGQVALARRESPHRGSRLVGLAHALQEMPHTALALSRGEVSEWRATLVAQETACLSRLDRGVVDAELASRRGGLATLGDRQTTQEARRVAYRLDPASFTRRAGKAELERSVTVRPAPDTMSYVTGLLPVRQGVAVYAALTLHADALRSQGDERSRGQIMADTLVERVTGQTTATAVSLEVHLVMTDGALFGADNTPVDVGGYGPVPAPVARQWLGDEEAAVWLRRLYTAPRTGELAAMDSTRRTFAGNLRRFIGVRDGLCRTPWCGAPIRHIDHPRRAADGGATSVGNGQGLCEACNLAKDAPGWRARARPDGTVETTTPTGHTYLSHVPPSPVARGPSQPRMDLVFGKLVLIA